jgi:DNA excision repair protein ERCC-6
VLCKTNAKTYFFYSAGERLEVEERERERQREEENEDNVLKSLFEMTGIQSALKHDQIMDSASHDAVLIEREATQIAERAAAALKESRRQFRKNDIGTPTWTGRSGAAGAPRQFLENRAFTPLPRFGQKQRPFESNSTPASPSQFGSGKVSGIQTGGAKLSSSTLLARMKERKDMDAGVSPESKLASFFLTYLLIFFCLRCACYYIG